MQKAEEGKEINHTARPLLWAATTFRIPLFFLSLHTLRMWDGT
jgi:hypothetical protein